MEFSKFKMGSNLLLNSANNLEETLEIDKMSRILAKKISEKFYV